MERSADVNALAMCLRAEETLALVAFHRGESWIRGANFLGEVNKERLIHYMSLGESGIFRYMHSIFVEYVIACKVLFATIHILEKTLGTSNRATQRVRRHPSARNRAFFLSLFYGSLSRTFSRRGFGLWERFMLGRAAWRFASEFLNAERRHLCDIVQQNDEAGWRAHSADVASALRCFS